MGCVLGNGLMFYPCSLILSICDNVRNLLSVLTSHAGGVGGRVVLGLFLLETGLGSAELCLPLG